MTPNTTQVALVVLALSLLGSAWADEPAWVAGWGDVVLPSRSADAVHREEYAQRAEVPATWRQERTRKLRFEVVAAESGTPLSGVLLSSWQGRQHGFTNGKGSLGAVPWYVGSDGAVFVIASAPGRRTSAGWVRPSTDSVQLALATDTRRTVVTVVTDSKGVPAAGCAWALEASEPAASLGVGVTFSLLTPAPDPSQGRADPEGQVVFRAEGTARVRASLPNRGCAEVELPVGPAWTLALGTGGRVVAGIVSDAAGNPLPGTSLTDTSSAAKLQTDTLGRFRFTHCLDGLYTFAVMGPSAEEATDVTAWTYEGQPRRALKVVAK